MMRLLGFVGVFLMGIGALCPLLHIPIIGNWNYFKIDMYLAYMFYFFVFIGLAGVITGKLGLMKFSGWATLALVLFTIIAVYFKVNNYFSFIPFKKLSSLASGMIKYSWGWFVIVAGSLIVLLSAKFSKS